MRAFRFARIYLSALEATGLVVVTTSSHLLDSRLFLCVHCCGKSFKTADRGVAAFIF